MDARLVFGLGVSVTGLAIRWRFPAIDRNLATFVLGLGLGLTVWALFYPDAWWLYGVAAIVAFGVLLAVVDWLIMPKAKSKPPGPVPKAAIVSLNGRNNRFDRITVLGSGTAIHEEGGKRNSFSDVKVLDPKAIAGPGKLVCWALRDGQWVTFPTDPDNIPHDVDGCMNPHTGETWSASEMFRPDPERPS